MQAQTFQYLLEWTSKCHHHLANCLEEGVEEQQDEKAKWLMEYLIDHERNLAREVEGFKAQADDKALKTWLYEHLTETLPPSDQRELPFGEMSFDEISAEIFDIHNQLIETYTTMESRAAIPEARDVMARVLELEQHETLRLADQITSSRDM
jgi:hypothetical protein